MKRFIVICAFAVGCGDGDSTTIIVERPGAIPDIVCDAGGASNAGSDEPAQSCKINDAGDDQ